MAPEYLHLIRHAEGYHNLRIENHNMRDPLLTPEGEHQCVALADVINNDKNIRSIDCIVASPMRRTLYTALNTFREQLISNRDLKIIALAELQETSGLPCDTGLPLEELKEEFKELPVDFALVPNNWNDKASGEFSSQADAITARARKARQFLHNREEKDIAVVTHGAFLHFLTGDWVGSRDGVGTGWANCDLRSYSFYLKPPIPDSNAHIKETEFSLAQRKHDQHPLTQDEQLEISLVTQKAWAADGYIVVPDTKIVSSDDGSEKTGKPVIAKIVKL